jgi:hypothetical protein
MLVISPVALYLPISAAAEHKKGKPDSPRPASLIKHSYAITVAMDPQGTTTFKQLSDEDRKHGAHLYGGLEPNDLLIKTIFTIKTPTILSHRLQAVTLPNYLPAHLFNKLREKNGDSVTFTLNEQTINAKLCQDPSSLKTEEIYEGENIILADQQDLSSLPLFEDVFKKSIDKAHELMILAGYGDSYCECCNSTPCTCVVQ